MKKLLMMGTSNGTTEMLTYARSIGVYTIVTDYLEPAQSEGKRIADEYWMISTANIDEIERRCIEEGVNAVFAGVSEFNLDRAMELCNRLGLPYYCTEAAWHYARSKHDFKKICRQFHVPVSEDYNLSDALTSDELRSIRYPVVVKANDLSGTKGMSYCMNEKELVNGYHLARSLSNDPEIIVEHMVRGREFAIYYALTGGEVSTTCISEELFPENHLKNLWVFTTTGTDCIERISEEVNPYMVNLLKGIGAKEGIAWIELMLDEDDRFYVLELGYRLSGDMMERILPPITGFNAYHWMIDYSIGRHHSMEDLPESITHMPLKCGSSYCIRPDRDAVISRICGAEELSHIPGIIVSIRAQEGQRVVYRQQLGILSINTDNGEEMVRLLKQINRTLHIYDEKGDDVFLRYEDYNHLRDIYADGLRNR